MFILLPVMDPAMHGRDNLRRLDKVLEIFVSFKVVSVEGNTDPGASALQVYLSTKNKPPSGRLQQENKL